MATAKKKPAKLKMGKGKLGYTTSNVFNAPLAKVWDGATLKKHLVKYFVDDVIGEFGPKKTPVQWVWKKYGSATLEVAKFSKHKEIVIKGPNMMGSYNITLRFEFVRKNGKTIFRVHESGYDPKDIKMAFMMCEGWTEFHTALKAYLKFGVDLRKA
jgi:uncharacterized protein YndB with AHSA1/START domain